MSDLKKLRTLIVSFDAPMEVYQTSAFRGAVIEKVGRQHEMFHNHVGDKEFKYSYPVIQYKIIRKLPTLYCVGEGVDEIHNFFGLKNWDINLNGKRVELKIHKLDLNTFNLNVWDKNFSYSLNNWLALNAENYKLYQALTGLCDKVKFLERLLTGNILSFAKGVRWRIEKPITTEITEISNQKIIRYKGVPLLAFDVSFKTNVFLPNYLGLGKSASHGFGVVKSLNKKQN